MAWNIHKPGQGYWTRLISGLGGGVLVAGGAYWLWEKINALNVQYSLFFAAAAAVLFIAVFGLLLLWWVGISAKSCDFLIATEGEMRKVNWPSRREVVGSTWVVIVCTFLLVAVLFLSDTLFVWFFQAIHVLENTGA